MQESELYQELYTALRELGTARALNACPSGLPFRLRDDWSFVRLDDGQQSVQQLLLLPGAQARRRWSYLDAILKEAPHQASRYQEGLLICYGSRRDVKGEDYERIAAGGVKFRGRRAWPFLRLLAPPAWPLRPSSALVAAFLPYITRMCTLIKEAAISEGWPEVRRPEEEDLSFPVDARHLKALRMLPQSAGNLLLDAAVLPGTRVFPSEDAPPVMQQALLSAAFTDERPSDIEVLNCPNLADARLPDYFIRRMEQSERPASVTVRDPEQFLRLENLCAALEIKLLIRPALPVIDPYLPRLQAQLIEAQEN